MPFAGIGDQVTVSICIRLFLRLCRSLRPDTLNLFQGSGDKPLTALAA